MFLIPKKTLLCVLCFVCLAALFFQPVAVFAKIQLELDYPNLPGIKTLTDAASSELGVVIVYYVRWILLFLILFCIIALIWAGFQYLTSAGQPAAMRQGKERIINAFLGLAILIASYLILKTVNPQMSLLQITAPSVPTGGMVLLTKTAYSDFDGTNFGDLVDSGQIQILTADVANGEAELGTLKDIDSNPPIDVNFTDFPLYAIGFWGDVADNYQVIIYDKANFLSSPNQKAIIYSSEGRLNEDTGIPLEASDPLYVSVEEKGLADSKMKIIVVYKFPPDTSIEYNNDQGIATTPASNVLYPPLSMKLRGIGNGVYLYGQKPAPKGAAPTETFFTSSITDLSAEGIDFDNIAEKIKIKNKTKVRQEEIINDYIAVLHDGKDYEGNMTIYFAPRKTGEIEKLIPLIYHSSDYFQGQEKLDLTEVVETNKGEVLTDLDKDSTTGALKSAKFAPYYPKLFPSINSEGGTDIGRKDIDIESAQALSLYGASIYGKVMHKTVSSITVYELSDDPTVCRMVKLCRQNNVCISYVPLDTEIQPQENEFMLPMPFYRPVNIPEVSGWIMFKEDTVGSVLQLTKWGFESFDNKIYSVIIDGQCLVALFEKKMNFSSNSNDNLKFDGFDSGFISTVFTGTHSYVLTQSTNLRNTNMTSCGGAGGIFQGGQGGCASAIAVFPIK